MIWNLWSWVSPIVCPVLCSPWSVIIFWVDEVLESSHIELGVSMNNRSSLIFMFPAALHISFKEDYTITLGYKRCDVYEKRLESLLLLFFFKFIFTEFHGNKIELKCNDGSIWTWNKFFQCSHLICFLQSSTRVGEYEEDVCSILSES